MSSSQLEIQFTSDIPTPKDLSKETTHSLWSDYQNSLKNPQQYCTLAEILDARDWRVTRQRKLLATTKQSIISVTLNVAGAVKQFPLARRCWEEASRLLRRQLDRAGYQTEGSEIHHIKTGSFGLYAVNGEALQIKRIAVTIEESSSLGRLFDIDVFSRDAQHISREDLGLPARKCLVCGRPGKFCARSHAHGLEEVLRVSLGIMKDYFVAQFADFVASASARSLLYEICTTPKPGLVDRNNTGSHDDMDMFTFMDSVSVLVPYFHRCTTEGLMSPEDSPMELFARLRYFGMNAEDDMFTITNGINTHKGAIFLLGILCAAAGHLHGIGTPLTTENLCDYSKKMTACLYAECKLLAAKKATSHGEKLLKVGITGARGEAASGFYSVRTYSLPVLKDRLAAGDSPERASVIALLYLMANVLDTNAITRTGNKIQEKNREKLKVLLMKKNLPTLEEVISLDREYIAQHSSPGGCADLLAVTWLIKFLTTGH